jgi:tRNA threonylcarbamoyladenosine biosynthesis protein TsaE
MTDTTKSYRTINEQQTLELRRKIGRSLVLPAVVLLKGCLGAGKTALTRGIVSGFGEQELSDTIVHSPTFSLVNQYDFPKGRIYHIDLYRLDTLQDQYSIGLEELLYEDALIIIEWSEKLLIPMNAAITIELEVEPDDHRQITIIGMEM